MSIATQARTFDELNEVDLEQVYQQGREEMLRDRTFTILLARADTVEKLEQFAFASERGLVGWTTKELIEISNRFRLLSSPENEIRLYRECSDETFRKAPRVREFYVLALNRMGRPAEAIEEASRLIAEGGQNALLWGTLGECYSARLFFAEQLAKALADNPSSPLTIDPDLAARFSGYFPHLSLAEMTVPLAHALRQENLKAATDIFRTGFRESGTSFCGLGWLLRTIDHLADLCLQRAQLQVAAQHAPMYSDEAVRLRLADDEIWRVRKELECQIQLVAIALELQGGSESLDYWTNAGMLLLDVIQNAPLSAIRWRLARLFTRVDAAFKLAVTAAELRRLRDQYRILGESFQAQGYADVGLWSQCQLAEFAIEACEAGRMRFLTRGSARDEESAAPPSNPTDTAAAVQTFLEKTVNFRALTGNLVAVYISGAIGRVGARVPDLLINRQVQEDLADIVETKVLQALVPEERRNPHAIIRRIQEVVGNGLRVGELQDLQSSAHYSFDARSDGLIALSGVDHNLRRYTRTATDLTATLLLQNGDCRETMYLNGALFACWQQLEVRRCIANALRCLDIRYEAGFQAIVKEEIPAILRYQLRGGQVAVYVDSLEMRAKYFAARASDTDPTGLLRTYGRTEILDGQPLTQYELENSILHVIYRNGTSRWLTPTDPETGRWRPLEHMPMIEGGIPIIPEAGERLAAVHSVQLLNLVEEHAMTFLYDAAQGQATFCDGFYNSALFDSPYTFDAGVVTLDELLVPPGLMRAGSRPVLHPDGRLHQHGVYLQFLPFSLTDYEAALVEGDIPGTIQLMGRTFRGNLQRERRRLEEGTSPIPSLLQKIHDWQISRQQRDASDRKRIEQQLAKVILELARVHPELVQMIEAKPDQPLIREEETNDKLYLVLSGELIVSRQGKPLLNAQGETITVGTGAILGEISALRGGVASATLAGQAVVLALAQRVIQQQLVTNEPFRQTLEALADSRVM